MSLALAGEFFTTELPGKTWTALYSPTDNILTVGQLNWNF